MASRKTAPPGQPTLAETKKTGKHLAEGDTTEQALSKPEARVDTDGYASIEREKQDPVLKNNNFLKLWSAQIISMTAQNIINYILIAQVTALTNGSSLAVSGVILAFSIPSIIFSAIAGVFVDRISKRQMLFITNVLRAAAAASFVITILIGKSNVGLTLPLLYAITFIFSTVSQFFTPAEASTIPLLVRRDQLLTANAYFNLTLTITQLFGFAIIGPILGRILKSYEWLYVFLAIMYIGCAVLTYFLPRDTVAATPDSVKDATLRERTGAVLAEVKEGMNFIRSDRVIFTAIIHLSIGASLLMMLAVIGPKLLTEILSGTYSNPSVAAEEAGKNLIYLLLPGGIGMVGGVIAVDKLAKNRNREAIINYSLLAVGGTLILLSGLNSVLRTLDTHLAVTPLLIIIGAITFVLGIENSFVQVPAQTILQERSPDEIRGRVFSAFQTVLNIILIFPTLLGGGAADLIGAGLTLSIVAVIVILVAGYTTLLYRRHQAAGQDAGAMPVTTSARELVQSQQLTPIAGVSDMDERRIDNTIKRLRSLRDDQTIKRSSPQEKME